MLVCVYVQKGTFGVTCTGRCDLAMYMCVRAERYVWCDVYRQV